MTSTKHNNWKTPMAPMTLAAIALKNTIRSRLAPQNLRDNAAEALAAFERGEKPQGAALDAARVILSEEVSEWEIGKYGFKTGRRGGSYYARLRAPNEQNAKALARVVARLSA